MQDSTERSPDPARSRGERGATAGLLLLLVALFHGPSLKNGFVYDDAWTVVGNSFLAQPRNLLLLLGRGPAAEGVPDAGRPTHVATEILDRALWGLAPAGWHLQSLLWHAAVVLLLYAALRRLLGGFLLPFTASALHAVHPLDVEAVAAVNYREDLLAAFFVLLALLAVGAARQRAGGRAAILRAGGVLALLLGLGAKENAAVAPLLLAAADLCRQPGPAWAVLRRHARDYALLAGAAVAAFAWRWWVMGAPGVVSRAAELPDDVPRWQAVPASALAFVKGLGQLVLPIGLSPEYARPGSGALALGALALLALVAATVLALRVRARAPGLALGLCAGVLAYLPNLGLVPLTNLRADRYLYLPSLGLCLAVAWVLVTALERSPRARTAAPLGLPASWLVIAGVLLVLGLRTIHQGRIWRNDLALWRHASAVAPTASRAWLNLAAAELHAGHTFDALAAVERSLTLAEDAHARELRALVRLQQGDLPGAEDELRRVLAAPGLSDQHRAQLLNNLGFVELRRNDPRAALDRFQKAVALAPRYEAPALNAARALRQLGRVPEAEAALRSLLERVPASSDGWRELAALLESQGRTKEAARALERTRGFGE